MNQIFLRQLHLVCILSTLLLAGCAMLPPASDHGVALGKIHNIETDVKVLLDTFAKDPVDQDQVGRVRQEISSWVDYEKSRANNQDSVLIATNVLADIDEDVANRKAKVWNQTEVSNAESLILKALNQAEQAENIK